MGCDYLCTKKIKAPRRGPAVTQAAKTKNISKIRAPK